MATRVKFGTKKALSQAKKRSQLAVAGGASVAQLASALRQSAAQIKSGKVGQPPKFLGEALRKLGKLSPKKSTKELVRERRKTR